MWVCRYMFLCVIWLFRYTFTICPRVLTVCYFCLFSFYECACAYFFVWFCLFSFVFIIWYGDLSICSFSFSFLPFLPSCVVAGRVLVVLPGVRPEPTRWESRVKDTGPPETSQPHVVSIGESSPRDLHLNVKTQIHSTTSKLQCWMPNAKQLATQEHLLPH